MKIFASWSGEQSREIAGRLKGVLEECLADTTVFVSEPDIPPGSDSQAAIVSALRDSDVIISCMTRDSLKRPWVQYEGGFAEGRDITAIALLHGLEPGCLQGLPQQRYQAVRLDQRGLGKLFLELRRRAAEDCSPGAVERDVGRYWPELDIHRNVLSELLSLENASRAPFLLSRASVLWRKRRPGLKGDRAARRALEELCRQIHELHDEKGYIPEAVRWIRSSSVWAVCGRKSPDAARGFYDANESSHAAGHAIERIFFPPRDREDAIAINNAIQLHLESGMTVRIFPDPQDGQRVFHQYGLPLGFGMTVMGHGSIEEEIEPTAVLVHWGGVDHWSSHHGVILEDREWTAHFIDLLMSIRGDTQEFPGPDLGGLLRDHPHYDP